MEWFIVFVIRKSDDLTTINASIDANRMIMRKFVMN